MTIQGRAPITSGAIAVALLVAACGSSGGNSDETPRTEQTTEVTEPAITAPPSQSPEEAAEVAIKETFEALISERDNFNANADEYSLDDLLNGDPVSTWRVISGGELEIMSQAEIWLSGQLNAVGETVIVNHIVSEVDMRGTSDIDDASSTACLDLTGFTFTNYAGESVDPSFEPDPSQVWNMKWTFRPDAMPEHGIEEPGWYLSELDVERGHRPC